MLYTEKLQSFIKRPSYSGECKYLYKNIKSFSPEGAVLDIGCGLGGMINYLEKSGVNILGIDPGDHLFNLKLRENKACQAFGEKMPFASKSFEAVYFMHSFAHLSDTRVTLKEVDRVLKPEGYLFIVTPNNQFEILARPIKKLLEREGRHHPDKTVREHYFPRQLINILELESFTIQKLKTFGLAGFQRILVMARSGSKAEKA